MCFLHVKSDICTHLHPAQRVSLLMPLETRALVTNQKLGLYEYSCETETHIDSTLYSKVVWPCNANRNEQLGKLLQVLRFFHTFFFLHISTFQLLDEPFVTGVVPSSPRFLPSILIAHRFQQSHSSTISSVYTIAHPSYPCLLQRGAGGHEEGGYEHLYLLKPPSHP